VRTVIRVAIGLALAAGGLTCLVYGIAQAIENGSCGTSSRGVSYGPACPGGFAPMILLMVLGTFVALIGAALAGAILRFLPALLVAAGAGVVLGIVDLNPDDTRPGYEVLLAVLVPLVLFTLPGAGRTRASAGPPPPASVQTPPPIEAPVQWQAPDRAARLRELEQLKQSGLMSDAEYTERRRQILVGL